MSKISECVEAFRQGNKQDAARLLPQIGQLADASLLHLAAQHGWMDIVIDLITKYKYNTNCKDSRGCTPLHYAAYIQQSPGGGKVLHR